MFVSVLVGLFFLFLSFCTCMLSVYFAEEKDMFVFFYMLFWTAVFLFPSMLFFASAITGLSLMA